MAKASHEWVRLVTRKRPSGGTVHYARWTDPDTGRSHDTNLDKLDVTNSRARTKWMKAKSKALADRRRELEKGAPIRTQTLVAKAVEKFLARQETTKRPNTVKAYRKGSRKFSEWAKATGLKHVEQLTLPRLSDFHQWLASSTRMKAKPGGRLGQKVFTQEKRSPSGINSDLTTIRAMLSDWRRLGLTPNLTRDNVRDALPRLPVDRAKAPILEREEIAQLLRAAIAHDAATFKLSRAEKESNQVKYWNGEEGSTFKHECRIAPLLVVALLTGARIGELLALEWGQVKVTGSPRLTVAATGTKTRTERAVSLSESPGLIPLFESIRPEAADSTDLVFPISYDLLCSTRERLIRVYGAPAFVWSKTHHGTPTLRATCGTYLTCSPSIYGAASAYLSASRLGHSIKTAERHYLGRVDVPVGVQTLEGAMGIREQVAFVARGRKAELKGEPASTVALQTDS